MPSMTSHQRILSALQGKPVDHIPFVPLIDTYTVLDMPEIIQHIELLPTSEGYWQGMLQALRAIGCDIMLRHVDVLKQPAGAPYLNGLGQFKPPVKTSAYWEGTTHIETLETPQGILTASWGFTERHGWIPHPLKHLVNNYDELQIFNDALDYLSTEPLETNHENFLKAEAAVGDDGIATASLNNTPLMELIEVSWGLENTYYLLHDYPQQVEATLEKIHQAQRRVVEQVAQSPAEVVIIYENTSSTLLSPTVFRHYCLPILNEYADILHAAGKIFLAHMCGKLRAFANDLTTSRLDGICDITPHPTGDFGLAEAAPMLPGKIVIGGIDPTTFVEPDLSLVEAQVTALIERVKPFPRVLLGSADTAPRGTPLKTFQRINRLAQTIGSRRPHYPATPIVAHPGNTP